MTGSDILAGLAGALGGTASIEQFRQDICNYFGVRHCFLASSGRAALSLLLASLHRAHPNRYEVVVPAYTSFSVPSAVVHAGLKACLYDIDVDTLGPDLASLEAALSERTLCIVVCHLYGYPCPMDAVMEVARRRGIPVVDDAAQAMGALYRGRHVGTLGIAGIFSLSRGKNISTVDGGIIVTDSDALAEVLSQTQPQTKGGEAARVLLEAMVLSFLLHPRLYWLPHALPFLNLGASIFDASFTVAAYSPFQAALGQRMLQRLKAINAARVKKADSIRAAVARQQGQHPAAKECSRFIQPLTECEPVYLRLPVVFPESAGPRPELGIVRSYPAPLNEITALKPHLVKDDGFPGARYLADNLVTVPTHHHVTEDDVEQIAAWVRGGNT